MLIAVRGTVVVVEEREQLARLGSANRPEGLKPRHPWQGRSDGGLGRAVAAAARDRQLRATTGAATAVTRTATGKEPEMAGRWVYPLDPSCPEVRTHEAVMAEEMEHPWPGAPYDEIQEDFETRHRSECKRCQEFGAANVGVEYA